MPSNLSNNIVTSAVLRGPRLKANRADQHINDILRMSQELPAEFYDFRVCARTIPPYAKPTQFELRYDPIKPIPETFALIIGDAVHNLRAALDHLASGIIRTIDPGAKRYFPVTKIRDNLEKSGDLALMETALPGSKELVLNKIRPVNGGRDHLWAFGSIDIDDKHNLVVPTITIATIDGISGNSRGMSFEGIGFGNDAAKPFIAMASTNPFSIQGKPHASVDVSFGPGTPFYGHPVVPTLLDIRQLVEETIEAFATLIGR